MKVLFIKFLPNVGHIWDIKEVSHAYATNFLIPKWYVKTLTPQEEQKIIQDEKKLEEIIKTALKNRILVLKSGKNIIRFLPPLNISKKEMKQGFKRFENVLIEIEK